MPDSLDSLSSLCEVQTPVSYLGQLAASAKWANSLTAVSCYSKGAQWVAVTFPLWLENKDEWNCASTTNTTSRLLCGIVKEGSSSDVTAK